MEIGLSKSRAVEIANEYLARLESNVGEKLALLLDDTLDRDYGWIFFFQTQEWIEAQHFEKMLAGNAPFLVEKVGGKLVQFGTVLPVEDYLRRYEAEKPCTVKTDA